ncbi:MAG: hypothetical protein AB7K24_25780 [Gemmataceae bacterium]
MYWLTEVETGGRKGLIEPAALFKYEQGVLESALQIGIGVLSWHETRLKETAD